MWFFRPVRNGPRVRLPDEYGSPEFHEAYRKALAAHVSGETKTGKTLAWLIAQYRASPAWNNLARETKKQFTYQLDSMKARDTLIEEFTASSFAQGRDARAHKPSDANKYLRCCVALFRYAVDQHWLTDNPAKGIAPIKYKGDGFHAWTEEEAQQFERHWLVGTRERLAFDLLVYTGVRRSDVVRLGPSNTRAGEITITTEKSRNMGKPVEVTISILPPLAASIAATPGGDTYLVTSRGKAFAKESFGNWFREACNAAGVPGSSHGLRKLAARRMAENGATEAELNAVFGWAHGSAEAATYIRSANRARLSRGSVSKMLPQDGRA
jgi:integrase